MDTKALFQKTMEFRKAAQTMTAQPGDVQTALEQANIWNKQAVVSPMLNQAGVPDDAAVSISILVSQGPKVGFNVILEPKNPKVSVTLSNLLKQTFSIPMTKAIQAAKLNVASLLVVNWLKF